jgi:membrane dipeptidase
MADINLSSRAADLHSQAIVIDAHCDILMPVADGITRLGAPSAIPSPANWVPPVRVQAIDESVPNVHHQLHTEVFGCAGFYSLPQWQQGGVTAQVCAIYLEDKHLDRALQRGLEMTWWLHQEVAENPGLALVTEAEQIVQAKQVGQVGTILALEGLEPLGPDLRFLDLYYKLGLRMACLTHNRRNLYGDGPVPGVRTGGLSELGRQAVRRIEALGIVVDLAHTNEPCFWEILELAQGPVIVSHLSPYLFARWRGEPWDVKPFNRELDREPLERIAKTNGVLGMIFYGQESLHQLVENIEILLDLVGPDHVGLGSDFYGLENTPKGLEDISQLPRLTETLIQRGHSDETILKILGGNFLRLFGEVWKA